MKTHRLIQITSVLLVVLFGAQYVLGMLLNFYVDLDSVDIAKGSFQDTLDAGFYYAAGSGGLLTMHWLNASILLFLALTLIALGVARRARWAWGHGLVIVLTIMAASAGGAAFIGYHDDRLSMLMAIAFPIAFGTALSAAFLSFSRRD